MKFALPALLASMIASSAAWAEPSVIACRDFEADMTRGLAGEPDALQVNNLLFEAARKGCVAALPALFDAHASRLARDRGGNTALAIASRAGRVEFVEALLAGAAEAERGQLDAPNVVGSTPLIQAALANRLEAAKLLIAAGADVDAIDRRGETALTAAAFTGNSELADLLLARGAKPDAVDATGKSAIVYAAARGAADIVDKLLAAGVDPNARYANGLTALMWAAGHADNVATEAGVRAVRLLLARGARVDDVDDRGQSALMIAAGLGHAEIVGILLEAGADKSARDKRGRTAFDLAATDEVKARLGGS